MVMTLRVISPNRKSTKMTKNKGKAAITAIKYSAPDRAMLFSFYNHPQPLWVWADGTSISLMKLNLHVDAAGKEKASIKGGRSNPERGGLRSGPRTGATQAVSRRKSSWISSVHLCMIIMNTMTNDCSSPKPNFLAHSLQIHCIGPAGPRSHPPCGIGLKNETIQ